MSAPLDLDAIKQRAESVRPGSMARAHHKAMEKVARDDVPALLLALQEAQDALRGLVEDCAPGPNESGIPCAPSERSYLAAVAVLGGVDETTGD